MGLEAKTGNKKPFREASGELAPRTDHGPVTKYPKSLQQIPMSEPRIADCCSKGEQSARFWQIFHPRRKESQEIAFPIPGATPGGVMAKLLNLDADKGIVTTIIHIQPGARIPAHYHNLGAEAHYVLDGEFIHEGSLMDPGGCHAPCGSDSQTARIKDGL